MTVFQPRSQTVRRWLKAAEGKVQPQVGGIYSISHITLHTTFKTLSRALKGLSARLWVREDRPAGGGQQDRRPTAVRTSSWPSAGSGAHRGGTRVGAASWSSRRHAAAKRCCLAAVESSFHSTVSQPPATHRVQPMVRLHRLRLARCEQAQLHSGRAGMGWQAHLGELERGRAQCSRSCPRPRAQLTISHPLDDSAASSPTCNPSHSSVHRSLGYRAGFLHSPHCGGCRNPGLQPGLGRTDEREGSQDASEANREFFSDLTRLRPDLTFSWA